MSSDPYGTLKAPSSALRCAPLLYHRPSPQPSLCTACLLLTALVPTPLSSKQCCLNTMVQDYHIPTCRSVHPGRLLIFEHSHNLPSWSRMTVSIFTSSGFFPLEVHPLSMHWFLWLYILLGHTACFSPGKTSILQ